MKVIINININNFNATSINLSTMNAHQLWQALVNKFKQKGALGHLNAMDYLQACRYKDSMLLAQHWAEMQAQWMNVLHFGDPIPDSEFCVMLYNLVSDALKGMVDHLYMVTQPEEIINMITTIYQWHMVKSGKHMNLFGGTKNAAPSSQDDNTVCHIW